MYNFSLLDDIKEPALGFPVPPREPFSHLGPACQRLTLTGAIPGHSEELVQLPLLLTFLGMHDLRLSEGTELLCHHLSRAHGALPMEDGASTPESATPRRTQEAAPTHPPESQPHADAGPHRRSRLPSSPLPENPSQPRQRPGGEMGNKKRVRGAEQTRLGGRGLLGAGLDEPQLTGSGTDRAS